LRKLCALLFIARRNGKTNAGNNTKNTDWRINGGRQCSTGRAWSARLGIEVEYKGNVMLDRIPHPPRSLVEVASFPLIDAIHGRRSRRFARGASIPDGPLTYKSKHDPAPLSELEQLLLLTTVSGNTGWSNLIPHNRHYLPKIPNYAGAVGGRSFPSAVMSMSLRPYFENKHELRQLTLAGISGADNFRIISAQTFTENAAPNAQPREPHRIAIAK
jgi:hypothetical protein